MKFTTYSLVLLAGAGSALANPRPKQNHETPAFDKRAPIALEKRQTTRTNTEDTPHTSISAVPTGPGPALSPCITNCITDAAKQANCASFTDLTCVCTSSTFQSAALSCLNSKCTHDEEQQALALQAQQCGSIGATTTSGSASQPTGTGSASPTATAPGGSSTGSITGSVTTQGSGSGSGSATTTGASATQTSNAAAALGVAAVGGIGLGPWIIVGLGVLVGGLVVA